MIHEFPIPLSELTFEYSRSSGPGGQNVNKTASRVQARWNVGASAVLTEEEKNLIREKLRNRLTGSDEIIVVAEEERSQSQNKERAIERLQELIAAALVVPKKRQPTKPTRAAKERRLRSKKQRAEMKKMRREKNEL